jgi:hypothetical protein
MAHIPKSANGFKRLPNEIWTEIEATNPVFQDMLQSIIEKSGLTDWFKGLNQHNSMMLWVGAGEGVWIWKKIPRTFSPNRIVCIYYHNEALIHDVDLIRSAMNFAWAKWGRKSLEAELDQDSVGPYLSSFRIANWKEKYISRNRVVLVHKIRKD